MNFIKTFFACLLAIVVGSIFSTLLSVFIFSMVIGAMLSGMSEPVQITANTVLHIDLAQPIQENKPSNPLDQFNFSDMTIKSTLTTYEAAQAIRDAASDPNIKGIFIDVPMVPQASTDALYELREAIAEFRSESEKFVIAYGDYYSQGTYWLASGADKIYLNPKGNLLWNGLSAQVMFYKQTLAKLGIEPEIFRHGKFKGAVEPFLLDKMSDENRLQMSSLSNSIWGQLVGDVASARSIDSAQLQRYADSLSIAFPADALKHGMVDSLCYRDAVLAHLSRLTDVSEEKDPNFISLSKYINRSYRNYSGTEKIALLYAVGEIMDQNSGGDAIVGNTLRKEIAKLRRDKNVKAVVLRVNSPGGSVLASDIIHHELQLLKNEKPLVVSMGDYAASGGYYISCPADEIVAAPTTLTGSIGVFGMWFNAQKGARDILGINVDVVGTNTSADLGNIFRPMTPAERHFMQNGVDSAYVGFVNLVAAGRDMSFEQVDSMAGGRVWSGRQALEAKLVDRLGTLNDAIELAAMKAGITSYRVSTYPKAKDTGLDAIFASAISETANLIFATKDPQKIIQQQLENIRAKQGIVSRMPFDIEINN